MKLLVITESIHPEYGGPSVSLPSLLNELRSSHDVSFKIIAVSQKMINDNALINNEDLILVKQCGSDKLKFAPYLLKVLWENSNGVDFIYSQNLWNYVSFCAFLVAKLRRIKSIVAPRGALTKWSLSQGKLRKKLVLLLFQKKALKDASFIHVTSNEEIDNIRQLGLNTTCRLVPHGISLPVNIDDGVSTVNNSLGLPDDQKYFLFMSRLHKKKGLDILLDVWDKISQSYPEWTLLIAGPDYDNYLNKIELLSNKKIKYMGVADDLTKSLLFKTSQFFVLPTYSENFGVVIGESLSYGVPVVTTTGTPWQVIEDKNCGIIIELNEFNLKLALEKMFLTTVDDMVVMSNNAKDLISSEFAWSSRARDFRLFLDAGCYNVQK